MGSPEARRRLRHFPLQYLTLQLHCGPAGSADMCEIHVGDKTDSLIGVAPRSPATCGAGC